MRILVLRIVPLILRGWWAFREKSTTQSIDLTDHVYCLPIVIFKTHLCWPYPLPPKLLSFFFFFSLFWRTDLSFALLLTHALYILNKHRPVWTVFPQGRRPFSFPFFVPILSSSHLSLLAILSFIFLSASYTSFRKDD